MELRHLRYFKMVAGERNFTRAAERLHIAQPPLSRQIRQLEEELGADLFVRGSRPLELTEAGRVLMEHAVQILERVDEISNSMRAFSSKRLIDFPIGFVGSTIYGALPRALRAFRQTHPDLDIRLLEMTTLEQLEALQNRRIMVGIGRLTFQNKAVTQTVLRDEPLVAALPCDSSLADTGETVSLAALSESPLIVYPRKPRPSYADSVLTLFRDRGLIPASVLEVRELQTALGLVAAGMGVTLIPKPSAELRQDIVYRPISDRGVVSPVVISRRADERMPAVAEFLQLLQETE